MSPSQQPLSEYPHLVTPNLTLASGDEGEFTALPLCILPPMPLVELLMIQATLPSFTRRNLGFPPTFLKNGLPEPHLPTSNLYSPRLPPCFFTTSPAPTTLTTWQMDKVVNSKVREVSLLFRFFSLQYNHWISRCFVSLSDQHLIKVSPTNTPSAFLSTLSIQVQFLSFCSNFNAYRRVFSDSCPLRHDGIAVVIKTVSFTGAVLHLTATIPQLSW